MKKKIISMEQPFHDVFYTGLRLGFELGILGHCIAPGLVGQNEKKVRMILQREIDKIFNQVKKGGGEA